MHSLTFRVLWGIALLAASAPLTFAESSSVLSWLSSSDQNDVLTGQEVTRSGSTVDGLELWKGSPWEALVVKQFAGRSTTLAAEGLYWLPESVPGDPRAVNFKIAKALTSVSTMKGLQVYSISLKRMETFIFDAYRVGSLEKVDRLPDPELSSIPDDLVWSMFQNEEQTGEGFTKMELKRDGAGFVLTQTNLTGLNWGIVPLVAPLDYQTLVYVLPTDRGVLIYGIAAAKTLSLFGWEKSKVSSLYTRMRALVNWFEGNMK